MEETWLNSFLSNRIRNSISFRLIWKTDVWLGPIFTIVSNLRRMTLLYPDCRVCSFIIIFIVLSILVEWAKHSLNSATKMLNTPRASLIEITSKLFHLKVNRMQIIKISINLRYFIAAFQHRCRRFMKSIKWNIILAVDIKWNKTKTPVSSQLKKIGRSHSASQQVGPGDKRIHLHSNIPNTSWMRVSKNSRYNNSEEMLIKCSIYLR